jgi:glycolate oxidase FAD binding subunit
MKLVHADGATSKSGGKVAKNVAGYDMNKLYVGSFGTLAIITELTFKLRPLPDSNLTLMITSDRRDSLFQLSRRALASELQPASVLITRRLSAPKVSNWPEDALFIRFIDNRSAVEHQVTWMRQAHEDSRAITVLSEDEANSVWTEVADFDQCSTRVRISVPLSAVSDVFEKAFLAHPSCVATADIGTGIIRLAFDANGNAVVELLQMLRARVEAANGSMVIEKASADARLAVDAWGDVGSTAELMRSIKDRFDPQALLNPGRFVLGL